MNSLCPECMTAGSAALLEALGVVRQPRAAARVTVRGLIGHAAVLWGEAAEDILGKRRWRRLILPRRAVSMVARAATDRSFPEIGAAMGGRDHSTVIHAEQQGHEHARRDTEFAWLVERLWAAAECEPWGPAPKREAAKEDAPARVVAEEDEDAPLPVVAIVRPGEYVPRHALPPVLAVVDFEIERPVAAPNDAAAWSRAQLKAGSEALLGALRREYPQRFEVAA